MSKKSNDSGFTVLVKLLKYTKPYTFYLVFTIISAIISAIATLYAPVLIGEAVDFIIDINNVNFEKIMPIIIKLAIVVLVGAGFQWFMGYCTNILTQRTVRDLRIDAFNKLQHVPLRYIDSTPHGDIIGRVVADIDTVSDGLLQGFQQIFTGSVTIIGTLCFMFSIKRWHCTCRYRYYSCITDCCFYHSKTLLKEIQGAGGAQRSDYRTCRRIYRKSEGRKGFLA